MIFVTGGAYQGQEVFAKAIAEERGYTIIKDFHLSVKEWLDEGKDPDEELGRLLSAGDNLLVVTDEIGGGIIPMDREDRIWREVHGRICCRIAQEADEVYRVVCGIGMRIK